MHYFFFFFSHSNHLPEVWLVLGKLSKWGTLISPDSSVCIEMILLFEQPSFKRDRAMAIMCCLIVNDLIDLSMPVGGYAISLE